MQTDSINKLNYNLALRNFLLGYLYIVTGYIMLLLCILLLNVSGSLFINIIYFILGVHLFLVILAKNLSISQIMPILKIYWGIILFVILTVIVALGRYVSTMFFFWFLAAAAGLSVLYSGRKLMYWLVYLAALVLIGCFCYYVQHRFQHYYTSFMPIEDLFHTGDVISNNSEGKFTIVTIVTIISSFTLVCHLIYYKHKITEIRINSLLSMIKEEGGQEKNAGALQKRRRR
jgi:hypothetical protein